MKVVINFFGSLACAALVWLPSHSHAAVLGFEDLSNRANFTSLGIVDAYQGFEWGYGITPGVPVWTNQSTGWASATLSDTAVSPPPFGVTGKSYAWNWNGPQSLWIDFKTPHNFGGGDFSWLGPSYGGNASTIQFFGYDASMQLVAMSPVSVLTPTLSPVVASLLGIHFVEIRANANSWFSLDNLLVAQTPLPAAFPLFGSALGLMAFLRWVRHRRRAVCA